MMFVVIIIAVLHIVASGATTLGTSSSSSSSIPSVEILASSSTSATLYSCYFADDNKVDLRLEKEACCKGVVEAWQKNDDNNNNNNTDDEKNGPSAVVLHQRCLLEMAQVPSSISTTTTPSGNPDDTAKFSWVVSKTSESAVKSTSMQQYLWTITGGSSSSSNRFQMQPIQTISPYHKTIMLSSMSNSSQLNPPIATKMNSYLGQDGGMYRLFHHTFQAAAANNIDGGNNLIYFIYLTVPQGMFIDLDDPFEPAATGTIQYTPIERADTDTDAADTSHSFVVTTSTQPNAETSSVISFRTRLHAATICDIEQPSFVSGQHLLVWEIDNIVTTTSTIPPVIEFATKLHLRYPHPSSTLEEWIDLPSPLLFAALSSESVMSKEMLEQQQYEWDLDFVERVWVAAGKDEDHDWIMGMTISFCLIGVAIMLRDISRASLWDDV